MKIGVLGAGHLGKIHIRCLKEIPAYELVGFYDPDPQISEQVQNEYDIPRYDSVESLIKAVEVIDIVTPTISHFECAESAMKFKRHVFIEKPLVTTTVQARELISLAERSGVKVQVGHVERFNPAFIAAAPFIQGPMFIETHRLAQFNPRGTDVPVILDLMIHDIDIILSVVHAEIETISASGVAVVSDTPDIANARLEFKNGCVANLTASRISMKNMRKTRMFQKDAYISVDFLEKECEIIRLKNVDDESQLDPMSMVIDLGQGKGQKQIFFEHPQIKPINAIKTELESFHNAILSNCEPSVTIEDGYRALDIAYRIMEKMNLTLSKL